MLKIILTSLGSFNQNRDQVEEGGRCSLGSSWGRRKTTVAWRWDYNWWLCLGLSWNVHLILIRSWILRKTRIKIFRNCSNCNYRRCESTLCWLVKIGQKLTKPCPQRRRRRRKVRLLWTRCSKRFMLMQLPTLMGALHHDVNSNLKAIVFYIIFRNASITLHICHSEMQGGFCALSTTEAPLSVKWFASRGKRVFPDRDPTQHRWTFRMFPNGDF